MNRPPSPSVHRLYQRWRAEDRELEAYLDALRDWIHELIRSGQPRSSELGERLNRFRDRLVRHFEREDEIVQELAKTFDSPPVELDATRRQAEHDHRQLLERLDHFIGRLEGTEAPFESWTAATEELELLVDVLEQHEEQESDSIELLMPRDPER